MLLRGKVLLEISGGRDDEDDYWENNTRVVQMLDHPEITLEVYKDYTDNISFKGYAPVVQGEISPESRTVTNNDISRTIRHGRDNEIIDLETDDLGTLYRYPVFDNDRSNLDVERAVSDEEFAKIVELIHPKEIDRCENMSRKR